jgi:hypothetical protein
MLLLHGDDGVTQAVRYFNTMEIYPGECGMHGAHLRLATSEVPLIPQAPS